MPEGPERLLDSARKAKRNLLLYGLIALALGSRIATPLHGKQWSVEGFGLELPIGWVYGGLLLLINYNLFAYWAEGGWDQLSSIWRKAIILVPHAASAPTAGDFDATSTGPREIAVHVRNTLKETGSLPNAEVWTKAVSSNREEVVVLWNTAANRKLTVASMYASLSWAQRLHLTRVAAFHSPQARAIVIGPIWDVAIPLVIRIPGAGMMCFRLFQLTRGPVGFSFPI